MKSALAAVLLPVLAIAFACPALSQELGGQDQGAIHKSASMVKDVLTSKVSRASRLGTSAWPPGNSDTLYIGHTTYATHSLPWFIGPGKYRPGTIGQGNGGGPDGSWDFDTYDHGASSDSAQGWTPFVFPNTRSLGTLSDDQRPWRCLDYGNRMNASPVQGRTAGIVSAWHADNGVYPLPANYAGTGTNVTNSWAPIAGSMSAWCGLRAGADNNAVARDDVSRGGTGSYINGNALYGRDGTVADVTPGLKTQKNFPGYANQWDQLLYRDVRVASNTAVTVSFMYVTQMDYRADQGAATCAGWFDKDPLSMTQGVPPVDPEANFISASAYQGAPVRSGPVDSFMVYVGCPTDPTACVYTDDATPRPIFDLKRRWFSEVIAIDKPYEEILSTFGRDSVYSPLGTNLPFSATVSSATINSMITAQGGGGAGVIRVVFRSKTNANYGDEQNTGGSFISTNQGAVRIDQVAITGATPVFTTSGFESASEINNNIEPANTDALPHVGAGYALAAWHGTGKPPKIMTHLHPIGGGDIGPGDYYNPLEYADLCGVWNSPIRQCNINNVVFTTTDHDLFEAAGGADGTPFKETRQGYISPAINLQVPGVGVNDCGIDAVHVNTNEKWLVWYDLYTGLFADFNTQGNLHNTTMISYPTLQKNGHKIWGDLGVTTGMYWWGDRLCLTNYDETSPFMNTSNASGIPDSVKIAIQREQRCISVGATNCSATDGHYSDNVTLAFPPPVLGSSDNIVVDIWDWYSDAFPRNEVRIPGTAAFDTCAALIFSARQIATGATDVNRSNISADSMFLKGNNSTGSPMRMDCIFRVYPGPGNYVIAGNKTSGLRRVPTSTTAASAGDGSWWGTYMASPGDPTSGGAFDFHKGTHVGHPSGWNVDCWNAVRCDTVETNIFPVVSINANLSGLTDDWWASTIHDSDPRLATLGITKNRCFVNSDLAGTPVNSSTIVCDGTVPAYAAPYTGATTTEYTKIFPDGLLTPGSSIQYFFRMSRLADPYGITDPVAMIPDTNTIYPQPQSGPNYDGQRWANISILPDKWKDTGYGGLGSACLLVVDQQDRRGDERIWVGIADSIGATRAAKYGAHNGWHCTGGYLASDGSADYTLEQNCGTDQHIAVWKNGGQPGSVWDLFNVTSAESPTGSTTAIGSRLAPAASGYQTGKDTKQGPTPAMLHAYYYFVYFLCGDMKGAYFGAIANKGSKDIEIVQDFLAAGGARGAWFMGDAFVEAHDGYSTLHDTFLHTNLGVSLRDPSYYALSGTSVLYPDLIPSSAINTTGTRYTVQNSCSWTNDVLFPEALVGAVAATTYQNLGYCVNCIAGVYTGNNVDHPYTTLVDGWDLRHLYRRSGGSSLGRLGYFMDVITNAFGSVCSILSCPIPCGFVAPEDPLAPPGDFVALRNNPLVAGVATVAFGLARPDRVEARVYDVAGRRVRLLADREFTAGEHKLVWDGTDDQGRRLARGVYFTAIQFIHGGFHAERKITILR